MADLQGKKEMVDDIQKKLSHACMRLCFSPQTRGLQQECLDNCYDKYTGTLASANSEIMRQAKLVSSQYGLMLDRDSKSMFMSLIYSEEINKYKLQDPRKSVAFDRSSNKSR